MDRDCANCGAMLVPYRTDRPHVAGQTAELRWCICPECRHVALTTWSLTIGVESGVTEPPVEGNRTETESREFALAARGVG